MQTATSAHREKVIEILLASFAENPSANDAIKQDDKKAERLRELIVYAVDSGYRRRGVYLSDDGNAAAICYSPADGGAPLRDTFALLRLIRRAIGFGRVPYMLKKEKQMKQRRSKVPMLYLFFLGTAPAKQGQGSGAALLRDLMELAAQRKLPLYLETSLDTNVQFYEKRGMEVYEVWEIRAGYTVRFMRTH
jgi:GNAT superfamily N-acetyltransferase